MVRDHPFKTSACLRGEGCPHVPMHHDGQKVTVHKDQKFPSQAFAGMPMVGG